VLQGSGRGQHNIGWQHHLARMILQLGQLSETVNVALESTLLQTEKADSHRTRPGQNELP
jgi:hypothetical protein